MKPVFKASTLAFKYDQNQSEIIQISDFVLFENETVLLQGPSGAGKSTLLRLIEGSITSKQSKIEIRNPVHLIYQDLRLSVEISVLENVLSAVLKDKNFYNLQFTKVEKEKALNLIEQVGLSDYALQKVSMLSGGQKQRVAIARALMSSPDILLGDECFNQLDLNIAHEIFHLIKTLQNEYKFCFVLTQHGNAITEDHFDRTIHLENKSSKGLVENKYHFRYEFIFCFILVLAALILFNKNGFDATDSVQQSADLFYKFLPLNAEAWLGIPWSTTLKALLSTLQMATLGTFLGFIFSVPLAIMASNMMNYSNMNLILRFFLMIIRTVPSLVWAIIFVAAVGIGPVAGVFALSIYSIGYMTKLIYEGLEDLDQKVFMTYRQMKASRFQSFWFALKPVAKPLLVSNFIFMLEYNFRAASILGVVGAGGIGQELMYAIEWRKFDYAGILIILMAICVCILDLISQYVRNKIKKNREI